MLYQVKDLSPEQRNAIETLLGRAVAEDEAVSIKAVDASAILPSQLTPDERKQAGEWLDRYFAMIDARREHISEEEEQAIIDEALRSTRPNYRPIR